MIINRCFDYLNGKSKLFLVTFVLGLDLFIGVVDYLTGYKVRVDVFYLVPIVFMAWFFGKKAGILMSFVAVLTSIAADALYGKVYHNYFRASWNTTAHFIFFVLTALLITRLRIYMQERTDLIFKLQNALSDVKELSGILPICASCKKIRDDEGYWRHVEEYLIRHTNAEFTHGLCKECSKKLYPQFDKESREKG
jgi:glucose-6-phosphate-specific signal transduction histidine kinase